MELKSLPKSLHDITLEQWVNWNIQYGKDLAVKAKAEKTADETMLYWDEFYSKYYSFYANTPLEDVLAVLVDSPDLYTGIIKEAALTQAVLYREMQALKNLDLVNTEFDYLGFKWKIQSPVNVVNPKELTVEEFEQSQHTALIFADLQDGVTSAIYELCSAYIVSTEGDKLTSDIIKPLPLYIALCVKRYVEETINLYTALANDREHNTTQPV